MRKSRFSDEQITQILSEARAGMRTADVCRKHGLSSKTFYAWRAKFGGMIKNDVRRLKNLEEENAKLKKLVANQALDILAMKDVLAKKW